MYSRYTLLSYTMLRYIFIKQQTHSNILATTSQVPLHKLSYIHIWQLSHLIKHLLLFFFLLSGRPTTLSETMGKAEMWLIRTYWDFSFPRPQLPNVEFVGGLHCKPAKPLPKVTYSSLLFFVNFVFSIGTFCIVYLEYLITGSQIWEPG